MPMSRGIKQVHHAWLIARGYFREDKPLIAKDLKHTQPHWLILLQRRGNSVMEGLTWPACRFRGRASNTADVPNPRADGQ